MKRLTAVVFASVLAIAAISVFDPGVASARRPYIQARTARPLIQARTARPLIRARQMLRSWRIGLAKLPARVVGSFNRRNNDGVLSQRALHILKGLDQVRDRGRASLMRNGLETGRLRYDVEQKLVEAGKRNISYELVEQLSRR